MYQSTQRTTAERWCEPGLVANILLLVGEIVTGLTTVSARERPDDCRGELDPAAVAPDPHREDAHPRELVLWDASDAALQDATDAADLRPEPGDAGVEKSAVTAPDARARDAWSLREPAHPPVPRARPALAAELCTPDAVQSAEQSCEVPEAVAGR